MTSMRLALPDETATAMLGARLSAALTPPMVIGLRGDLGAGKTALVRAMLHARVPGLRVKSPTYTLIESYGLPGGSWHHLDLYRLRHPDELLELGLDDCLGPDAIMLIEWPDKGGTQTPPIDLDIVLTRPADSPGRVAELRAATARGQGVLDRLATQGDQSVPGRS